MFLLFLMSFALSFADERLPIITALKTELAREPSSFSKTEFEATARLFQSGNFGVRYSLRDALEAEFYLSQITENQDGPVKNQVLHWFRTKPWHERPFESLGETLSLAEFYLQPDVEILLKDHRLRASELTKRFSTEEQKKIRNFLLDLQTFIPRQPTRIQTTDQALDMVIDQIRLRLAIGFLEKLEHTQAVQQQASKLKKSLQRNTPKFYRSLIAYFNSRAFGADSDSKDVTTDDSKVDSKRKKEKLESDLTFASAKQVPFKNFKLIAILKTIESLFYSPYHSSQTNSATLASAN